VSELGLVLIHGFTSDQRSMQPVVEIAESLGYAVETPLLRGHGQTYRDLRGTSWDDWMVDVSDAVAKLRTQTSRVAIVGFSMGGLLALATAAQHPDLAGIVVLAPALRIAHPMAPYAFLGRGWLRYVPMGKSVAYSDPAMAVADDSYGRLALDAFVSFYRATRKVERLLPRIKAPLLVMHALRDRVIKPEAATIAYTQVQSLDKQLVWLEHSGHSLLADVETERVLEHVRAFLSNIRNKQQTVGENASYDNDTKVW
jgi:carboxylesterase